MNYKGFYGSIEFSLEDGVLFGKIECVNDLVNYEADTLPALKIAFEEAVDDYIDTCEAIGKSPDKPMSGSFNIRIGSELHKKTFIAAANAGKSLNDFIKSTLEEKINFDNDKHLHVHIHAVNDEENQVKLIHAQPMNFTHQSVEIARQHKWRNH